MSRYQFPCEYNSKRTFSFGFDRMALGYFYDIYDEELDVMIEEKSSMFDKLTGVQLAQVVEQHSSTRMISRYQTCLDKMKLDLEF